MKILQREDKWSNNNSIFIMIKNLTNILNNINDFNY